MRWLLILSRSAISAFSPSPALAVESPGLNWVRLDGAAECMSSAELAAAVNARVGDSVFVAPDQARLLIEGHVRRAADGWTVTLDVIEPSGNRVGQRQLVFAGESCHVIDQAVTLVIAVTLYPNTRLLESGSGPNPQTLANLDRLFADEPSELDPPELQVNAPMSVAAAPVDRPHAPVTDGAQNAQATAPGRTHVGPVALSLGAIVGSGEVPGVTIAGALLAPQCATTKTLLEDGSVTDVTPDECPVTKATADDTGVGDRCEPRLFLSDRERTLQLDGQCETGACVVTPLRKSVCEEVDGTQHCSPLDARCSCRCAGTTADEPGPFCTCADDYECRPIVSEYAASRQQSGSYCVRKDADAYPR